MRAGQHYFTMRFVDGTNLAALVGHVPLAATRAARYVKTIAEAVDYAHQQGVLHRDLKPSNMLIDSQDQPRITRSWPSRLHLLKQAGPEARAT